MKCLQLTALTVVLAIANLAVAAPLIVDDGKPNAAIVIAEKPLRTQRLAAEELRDHVKKMSGAELPIVRGAKGDAGVTIYVGDSEGAKSVGVTSEGLDHGAYRVVSGDDWLALIGHDRDYLPPEPWARNRGQEEAVVDQWRKRLNLKSRLPIGREYKEYSGNTIKDYGKQPNSGKRPSPDGQVELWQKDFTGSHNAVCDFLRSLGIRWYMPGELGEIIPDRKTIPLPSVNKTVEPDIKVRYSDYFADHGLVPRSHMLWARRNGMVHQSREGAGHSHKYMLGSETIRRDHPEYFSLQAHGERSDHHACLSSPGFRQLALDWCRKFLDNFDSEDVSVMPADGFKMCHCPLCEGKDTPERGRNGTYSDYVWGYVNWLAGELAKTHPGKEVICEAYSTYTEPPAAIDQFNPNVRIQISNGRPRFHNDDERFEHRRELRGGWLAKTQGKLALNNKIRPGMIPGFLPHIMARGIRAAKDGVFHEELAMNRMADPVEFAAHHLVPYVTGRYWWDSNQDLDAMLEEYYDLFYGPAAAEMKRFTEYCENNFSELGRNHEKCAKLLDCFDQAKAKVSADSIYGKRLALIDEFLKTLRKRRDQLATNRQDNPRVWALDMRRTTPEARDSLVIDGKLDEPFWEKVPSRGTEVLRDIKTGDKPGEFKTQFKVAWLDDSLCFGIRCEDRPGKPVNITTTNDGDFNIFNGDAIEILIETDYHHYYQLAISPAGHVWDQAKGALYGSKWDSEAEVGAHVGKDYWSLEVRVPMKQSSHDPLRNVIGQKPTETLPWYFRVGRQRMREGEKGAWCFPPSEGRGFHHSQSFARLYQK